jgi:hypothetical protein
MFVLLPEAGQFLHAAHLISNQMVDVHPSHPVVFRYRDLVWASGTLTRTIGSPGAERADYALTSSSIPDLYQLRSWRTLWAWRRLTMNS